MNKNLVLTTVLASMFVVPFAAICIVEEVDSHKKRLQEMELKERKAKEDKERLDKELKDKEEYWASLSSEDKVAIENKKLEMKLKDAKIQALESAEHLEKIYSDAIEAMKRYSGHGDDVDNLERKISRLSERIDDLPKGNSSCSAPSSSPITIAPVISGK